MTAPTCTACQFFPSLPDPCIYCGRHVCKDCKRTHICKMPRTVKRR